MARRRRRQAQRDEFPAWVWMLFGLGIGLSVALAIWLRDDGQVVAQHVARGVAQPAIDHNGEKPKGSPPTPVDDTKPRFDFYEMLPNFEVVVPEQEQDVRKDIEPKSIEEPGIYILQAGSFSNYSDADRRRAELAMHGIESTIQRVQIDARTYHRVRIGPIDNLKQLNLVRSRLHAAHIDALRIRVGD